MNGIQKKDEGNTTLPINYKEIKSIAILDIVELALQQKIIWENWGQPAVKLTYMNLQLADKILENPIGLLEYVTITSYGLECKHTFA